MLSLAAVSAALLSGCAGSGAQPSAATVGSASGTSAAQAGDVHRGRLIVPQSLQGVAGVYLGIRANPAPICGGLQYACFVTQLHAFEAAVGRTMAMYNSYYAWSFASFPTVIETDNAAYGRYSVVAVNCGDTNANVAAGKDDATIIRWAQQIKAFGQPVLMRWFWEMNLDENSNSTFGSRTLCYSPTSDGSNSPDNVNSPGLVPDGYFSPQEYVAAWQHIHDLFAAQGVTNVTWLWNASGGGLKSGAPIANYYPGDDYVDWIGFDMYDRTDLIPTPGSLAKTIAPMYLAVQAVTTAPKPMMIAETGATAANQPSYLTGVDDTLRNSFPQIRAFEYFDVAGSTDWSLSAAGLSAFTTLAAAPYFSTPGP
jgi:hypothetical protein